MIDDSGWGRYNPEGSASAVASRSGMATDAGTLGGDMLEELRGRNLAHVGCTIGLTLGLLLGLVAALVIVTLVRAASATNWATVAWFGLTFGLGVVGYWAGGRISRRLWGEQMRRPTRE